MRERERACVRACVNMSVTCTRRERAPAIKGKPSHVYSVCFGNYVLSHSRDDAPILTSAASPASPPRSRRAVRSPTDSAEFGKPPPGECVCVCVRGEHDDACIIIVMSIDIGSEAARA